MAAKKATYDDFLRRPEHVAGEILDGTLVLSPQPAPEHAHAASAAERGPSRLGGDV